MTEERLVTEVPSSLKQLARLVVRGFYTIEDALIVDMLVRNPCMKEDDICELLKFERKMLRARIATLKNDKFIQVRLKMETGLDGKAQKVNYYFINYKTFVNVVKYKLDLMRKRMETEERDATSRASFKCPSCGKTFTDLEADQLYDMMTQEFRCTFCSQVVEEDQSALPKKDSRLLLAKFNEQLETLYILLREVEGIKLSPEILEPEPVDINTIRGLTMKQPPNRGTGEQWSGDATRHQGLAVEETRVDVTIGESDAADPAQRKERPVWMVESTVLANDQVYIDRMVESTVLANDQVHIVRIVESTVRANDQVYIDGMVESTVLANDQIHIDRIVESTVRDNDQVYIDEMVESTVLANDQVHIDGMVESTVRTDDQVYIDGMVENTVLANDQVHIDRMVESTVRANDQVYIDGMVESTVLANDQIILTGWWRAPSAPTTGYILTGWWRAPSSPTTRYILTGWLRAPSSPTTKYILSGWWRVV
ncbi:unnamed protein product [Parnassius apollo]|uniref:General transcription factor IIE subunit 1 n=1 Tax=Parnassius apollo TaxID=110799 RepID=A0A8S3XTS7_PARAO|nr:unnamed protein product [Parnassius apollo]